MLPTLGPLDKIPEEENKDDLLDKGGKIINKKKIRRLLQIPKPKKEIEIEFQDMFISQPEIIDATKQWKRIENSRKKLHALMKKTKEKPPSPHDSEEVKGFQEEWQDIEAQASQATIKLKEHNEKLGELINAVQRLFPTPESPLTAESMDLLKAACEKFSDQPIS